MMKIAAKHSFNNGRAVVEEKFPEQLVQIIGVIEGIDAAVHMNKESKEKTMPGEMLYSPSSLNSAFKAGFKDMGGWRPVRVWVEKETMAQTRAGRTEVLWMNFSPSQAELF